MIEGATESAGAETEPAPLGFGSWLETSETVQATAVLSHVAAVAAGQLARRRISRYLREFDDVFEVAGLSEEAIDTFAASLADHTDSWRQLLYSRLVTHVSQDRALIAISTATFSSVANINELESGAAIRRTDAVLDMTNIDSCAAQLRAGLLTLVDAISGTQSRQAEQVRDMARRARPLAEVLTAVHPLAGMAASYGLGRLTRPEDSGSDTPSVAYDEAQLTLELARVVLACQFAFANSDRRVETRRIQEKILRNAEADQAERVRAMSDADKLTSSQRVATEDFAIRIKETFGEFKRAYNQEKGPQTTSPPSVEIKHSRRWTILTNAAKLLDYEEKERVEPTSTT